MVLGSGWWAWGLCSGGWSEGWDRQAALMYFSISWKIDMFPIDREGIAK